MRYFIIMMSVAFFTLAFTGCVGDDPSDGNTGGNGTGGEAVPDGSDTDGATGTDFVTVTLNASKLKRVEVLFNNGAVVGSLHLIEAGDCVKAPTDSINQITSIKDLYLSKQRSQLCAIGSGTPCSGSYEVVTGDSEDDVLLNSVDSTVNNCVDVSEFYTVTLTKKLANGKAVEIKDETGVLTTLKEEGNCVRILTAENADGSKKWWNIDTLDIVFDDSSLCTNDEGGCSVVNNYAISLQGNGMAGSPKLKKLETANDGQQCVWLKSPTP